VALGPLRRPWANQIRPTAPGRECLQAGIATSQTPRTRGVSGLLVGDLALLNEQ